MAHCVEGPVGDGRLQVTGHVGVCTGEKQDVFTSWGISRPPRLEAGPVAMVVLPPGQAGLVSLHLTPNLLALHT